jgi:hypothetical protein
MLLKTLILVVRRMKRKKRKKKKLSEEGNECVKIAEQVNRIIKIFKGHPDKMGRCGTRKSQ